MNTVGSLALIAAATVLILSGPGLLFGLLVGLSSGILLCETRDLRRRQRRR